MFHLCSGVGTKQHIRAVLRRETKGLRVVRFGFLQLIELAVDVPSGIIATRGERIVLDGGVTIPQRTLIVLQLDLCNRTVEIGFAQVRLEPDDLIEILYREHVVLKIQRIPPDSCDAVGIELRKCTKGQCTKYKG